ncbi:reverse transcriptase domain-containing protein [Pseudomonas gingeri]|uniref:RNA-directed DNA polymerase n=1 Tax=Pseudomonas gingeri TaxID=117681 RepID=A0A7Y8BIE5_9PSED|nr:reverse transcriptase domain-containing protein [Pseudomonas gingeri]NWB44906.1 RNA-directed DNA polymerase [Pseudomonas gingeri]
MVKKELSSIFEAMYHGKYNFQDFLTGNIETHYKITTLKGMEIYRPDEKLKAYHKFLNLFIFDFLQINKNVVYSYRKGVNVASAVQKHAGNRHFFQTDLKSFFNSIDNELVRETVQSNLETIPISDLSQYLDRILELSTVNNKLPIGFSTSPIISNACLKKFDSVLEDYCITENLVYTRYSDDIILSGGGDTRLYGLDVKVAEILKECFGEKLNLNPSKTKFSSVGNKIKILGMVILPNGTVTIDSKLKNTIEVLLHFYASDKEKFKDRLNSESSKLKGDNSVGLLQISGYLNYVNTTDPNYLNKLRKKYGSVVVDAFIRGTVK